MITEVIGPTLLLMGIGYCLGRFGKIPAQPFTAVSFWILSPALIFESLRTAQLPMREAGLVALFVFAHYGLMFLLSLPVGRMLFPTDRNAQRATSLLLTFGNCGNFGLPILVFAYGQGTLDVGVIFLATNTVLLATLGVGIAGWEERPTPGEFLRGILTVPWPYAILLALIAKVTHVWPAVLARASALLSQAAIPIFLLVLGLELSCTNMRNLARPAVLAAWLRLILASALAWGLAYVVPVASMVRKALVVEGSVPSAVNAYILASQYKRRPDFAAAVLLLSTVFALVTISLTLFLLRYGG
ncbi:MAG: AEC family transporter [Candidatus Bipolaricaulota bacterium]|nr:AEC family transporter [Candidatus Bipolaricaulota bacterium]MDW8126195.1 AEC family transporter [Candidatus Bipolaricaulota bacterium]